MSETEEGERGREKGRVGEGEKDIAGGEEEGGCSAQHAAADWFTDLLRRWRDSPPDRCGDLEKK